MEFGLLQLASDDDEETVNLVSATLIFSSYAPLFGLKRNRRHCVWVKGWLCMQSRKYGIGTLVFVRLFVQMECDRHRHIQSRHTAWP